MFSASELRVAAVQMVSSDRLANNLVAIEEQLFEAVSSGAKMVVLPENFALMPKHPEQLLSLAERLGEGVVQDFLSKLSAKHQCWIVAGSLPIKSYEENKAYATCLVYNDMGEQLAHYHKIHLFDADIADSHGEYRESATFVAGSETVVVDTPFGTMGLSICYDLRFPELYRQLLDKGADFIVAPSAFTKLTGRAHWALLCRTRAVENTCYLIAANQGGIHTSGRTTYGHSMIIDPLGTVLSELDTGVGFATATLKRAVLNKVRTNLPAIQHRRLLNK
ncbi:MAG: apolipoprotein acyltransferase [Cycloclasticus sp. symbiont of Poecilosclerida sp. N]|nr:MAG: apolipoprotein acyltransferase [Cycloclasticus sp. symbiont of Poecilosclerida sp. N]